MRARGRLFEIGDDAQERRLAAAGRADERNELALADRQVDIGQRLHRPVIGLEGQAELLGRNDRLATASVIGYQSTMLRQQAWHSTDNPIGYCVVMDFHLPLSTAIVAREPPDVRHRKAHLPVVRPADTYGGKQGLNYFAGIAAETVGSTGICMHLVTIPPGGAGQGASA